MGPLDGLRVVEIAAIGPAPFAGMLLADLGADVVRVDRLAGDGRAGDGRAGDGRAGDRRGGERPVAAHRVLDRGRRSIALDLADPRGVEVVLRLVERADVLLEGFRPGVAERLGIGPEPCRARNPALIYGRMTGWGQAGPLSGTAGHDINYLALSGALAAIGPAGGPPVPPLNLLGDFGAGGLLLVAGILAALYERQRSGTGQVVDAAIVDGVAGTLAMLLGMRAAGAWRDERGANLLDGGAPFYTVYPCADGRYLAVGALEERFYQVLLQGLGLDGAHLPPRMDPARWPRLREVFAARFATRDRAAWLAVFAGTDACVTPVLTVDEAAEHPHQRARDTYVTVDGLLQPAAAPRFSRTPGRPGNATRADTREVLAELGLTVDEIDALLAGGVAG